jgi:hypothetical protein
MPDWTYRTFLKPALKALPRSRAHDLVVRSLALLASTPGGPQILRFFGHMQPDPRLRVAIGGLPWSTPIGIGAAVDPRGIACRAWAQFGVGFVEVRAACDAQPSSLPTWVRLTPGPPESLRSQVATARKAAVGFVLEPTDAQPDALRLEQVRMVSDALRNGPAGGRLLLVAIDARRPWEEIEDRVDCALAAGANGVRLECGWNFETDPLESQETRILESVLQTARRLRERFGKEPILVAGGAETADGVVSLRRAGVDLVVLDAGLVRSGPGLPKRVNAALLFQSTGTPSPVSGGEPSPWSRRSWFWCALLGVSMLVGGLLAFIIASTRVVLPYDEAWCSTTRDGFAAINPRLLPFLAHDRVTLAGTMISLGGLYLGLAVGAVRRGAHWAQKTVIVSATAGFLSFFLFLGFGYFDPFHAFVTAILFQFLLMALYAELGTAQSVPYPDLEENAAWRRGQWGQLLFVLLGLGLTGAGVVIASIGIGEVLVREDLEYMGTSIEALRSANPRLIPLVAHDRASLGGMLVANGLGVWLAAQWGFVGGARWLWWTLVLSGIPAFVCAIGVHLAVGYTDPWHLAPAMAATVLFALAAALARGWLCGSESARRLAWETHLRPGSCADSKSGNQEGERQVSS